MFEKVKTYFKAKFGLELVDVGAYSALGIAVVLLVWVGWGLVKQKPQKQKEQTAAEMMLVLADQKGREEELFQIAEKRKTYLDGLYNVNPELFLQEAVLADKREVFSEKVKPLVEEKVEVKDNLVLKTYVDYVSGRREEVFSVSLGEGRIVALKLVGVEKGEPLGRAMVSGKLVGVGDRFVANLKDSSVWLTYPRIQQFKREVFNVAVVPVWYEDQAGGQERGKESELAKLFWGDRESAKLYMTTVSDAQINLTGKVWDKVVLEEETPEGFYCLEEDKNRGTSGGSGEMSRELKRALSLSLARPGLLEAMYGNEYQAVVVAFEVPALADCSGAATYMFGKPVTILFKDLETLDVTVHELGHNLGFEHAGGLLCPDGGVLGKDCGFSWQGATDESDIMGYTSEGVVEYGAWPKLQMEWVNPLVIETSGEYELGTVSMSANKNSAAVINISDKLYYLLSYRTHRGFDSYLNSRFFQGLSVHVVNRHNWTSMIFTLPRDSLAGSGREVAFGSVLRDGESVSNVNGVRITQISHSFEGGKFRVELGGVPGDTDTPMPTKKPTPTSDGDEDTPTPTLRPGEPTPTPTKKPTPTPTLRPGEPTPTKMPVPTRTPTPKPGTPTKTPTPKPTIKPSKTPTPKPTPKPTIVPACVSNKNTEFWYNCPGEPYSGCGGVLGWTPGKDVTSANPALPFDLDINCFANIDQAFADARIELTGPDGKIVFTSDSFEGRDYQVTKPGKYTAHCISKKSTSCRDTDTFTVGFNTLACPYGSTQVRVHTDPNLQWATSVTVNVGQNVLVGGFHNNSGVFASPADVDFWVASEKLPGGAYPVNFSFGKAGTYTVEAKTRDGAGSYYAGGGCGDKATVVVR